VIGCNAESMLKYAQVISFETERYPFDKLLAAQVFSPFYTLYHTWVADLVASRFGKKISYSAHPKMRVHLAGTGCVSEFHRDAEVTGRPDPINCYLPFTDVFDTNTVWCESSYGLKDYQPINLKYGEAFFWDGGVLEHGTFRKRKRADAS
jgi:hypothetical protein